MGFVWGLGCRVMTWGFGAFELPEGRLNEGFGGVRGGVRFMG